eukprot:scaffold36314_cov139-Isochrysis_galbana.AAC.3
MQYRCACSAFSARCDHCPSPPFPFISLVFPSFLSLGKRPPAWIWPANGAVPAFHSLSPSRAYLRP